ncbi:hypothetical protein E4U41_006984 [Claviceps citrina]|nr:hypothetical protein E4U41_006984 [Claviceps citrina]
MSRAHPPNIYIVGAQCTGKTTLVNALAASFDAYASASTSPLPLPAIIREVARSVLSKHHLTAHDIRISPDRCSHLQLLILQAQHASEQHALETSPWFISDRSGLDPLIYAERHVGAAFARKMLSTPEWRSLGASLARSVIFVCEPTGGWLADDGVRLMPLDGDDWQACHRRFCAWLAALGLEYRVVPSTMPDLGERVRFVWHEWEGSRKWRTETGLPDE